MGCNRRLTKAVQGSEKVSVCTAMVQSIRLMFIKTRSYTASPEVSHCVKEKTTDADGRGKDKRVLVTHSGPFLALKQRRVLKDGVLRQFCRVDGEFTHMRQYQCKYKRACLKT